MFPDFLYTVSFANELYAKRDDRSIQTGSEETFKWSSMILALASSFEDEHLESEYEEDDRDQDVKN